jgi:hypothetical protein
MMAAGLRATAKAGEHPPEPKVGAPVLDPTSVHNWRPDAISYAYQIAQFPEGNHRLASDCTSCPVTEEFGKKILTSIPASVDGGQVADPSVEAQAPLPPPSPDINQLLRLAAIEQWRIWRDNWPAVHFVTSKRVVPRIVKTSRSLWFQSSDFDNRIPVRPDGDLLERSTSKRRATVSSGRTG